jgi:hypothetical protein
VQTSRWQDPVTSCQTIGLDVPAALLLAAAAAEVIE